MVTMKDKMNDRDRLLMELHAVLRNAGSISLVTGTYKDQLIRRIEEALAARPEGAQQKAWPDHDQAPCETMAQCHAYAAACVRQGHEEAAKLCEDHGHSNGRIRASHKHLAAAIRALKLRGPQDESSSK